MYYARSFHDGSGAFRETGALRFLFVPKGALTHHLPAGQAVVAFPLVRPCALRGGLRSLRRAPDNAAETAVPVIIVCAEELLRLSSACENLHPAALSQRQGESKMIVLLSLWRKEKQKKDWR